MNEKVSSNNTKMKRVFRDLDKYAGEGLPVLFIGEDGINLEYYAKLMHSKSQRKNKTFLAFKAVSEADKINSLFLKKDLKALENGTVFLNEMEKIDKGILREIVSLSKEKDILLLGGITHNAGETLEYTEEIKALFDNRKVTIPPLRERKEDIPQIVEALLSTMEKTYGLGKRTLSKEAQRYILRYSWPGNDREIEDTIKKAYILSEGEKIEKKDIFAGNMRFCPLEEFLSFRLKGLLKENSDIYATVLGEVEKALISIVLKEAGGNQLKASRILGINRNTLRSKIKEYGLSRLLTK